TAQFLTREADDSRAVERLGDLIKSELNVKAVSLLAGAESVVQYVLNPLPQVLGKRLGKNFPAVQKALREGAQTDVSRWAKALSAGETVTLEIDGESFEVTPEEVEVRQQA